MHSPRDPLSHLLGRLRGEDGAFDGTFGARAVEEGVEQRRRDEASMITPCAGAQNVGAIALQMQ